MVSDEDAKVIARDHVVRWQLLSPHLGLSQQEEDEISKLDLTKRKHKCLEVWKKMKGNEATYGALIIAAERAGFPQLATAVRARVGGKCMYMYTEKSDPWCE